MADRTRIRGLAAATLALVLCGSPAAAQAADPAALAPSRGRELERLRAEIAALEREVRELGSRERDLEGELGRVDAELRLKQKELDEVTLRRDAVDLEIARRDERAAALEQAQGSRREWLEFRLREIYKSGADEALRRFVEGDEAREYWSGLGYAAFLSERDRELIREFHEGRASLDRERGELARAREELVALEQETRQAREALGAARRRHAAALDRVRADQRTRRAAIEELALSATELERVIGELGPEGQAAALDIRAFKGLLEWPAAGPLAAGFGTVVHPQFKTEVPHPGWDIAAEFGADIRSVFDGVVVFADWMRGYGLTAIVDHGGGLLSIYAHASVLLARSGERVERGQLLGKVGESASLRGPVLYFELRDNGRAVDPRAWLRPR